MRKGPVSGTTGFAAIAADPPGFLQKFSRVQLLGANTMVFSRTGQFRGFTGIPGGGGAERAYRPGHSVAPYGPMQDGGKDKLLP